jgi:hypothetical protein
MRAEPEDTMKKIALMMTVLAGLAVMAAPVLAQTGQDRERPGLDRRGMRGGGPAANVRVPGAMLLERRAELGLTAEQVRQIEAIQARVQAENAPRLEQLRAEFGERQASERPARGARQAMTAEERQAMRDQMRARADQLRPVMQEVRETNRAAGDQIHALLTTEQKAALFDLRREARGEWQNRRGERRDGFREGRGPRGPRGGIR